MLLALFRGNLKEALIVFLLLLPTMLFSLSLHETMHGLVALKLGDPTARNMGRLTLNPRKHIDPIGFLVLMLVGFGWAKPVPVNARNFKNPKWGMALVALAGPLSNFLLGAINAAIYGVLLAFYYYNAAVIGLSGFRLELLGWSTTFFFYAAVLNFIYSIFNMIPIPPYDGSRVLYVFLPPKAYFAVMKYERYILYGLLAVLILCNYEFGFSPFSWVAEKLTDLIANPIASGIFNALI